MGFRGKIKTQGALIHCRLRYVIRVVFTLSFYLSTLNLSLCTAAFFNIVLLISDARVMQPSLPFMVHSTHFLSVYGAKQDTEGSTILLNPLHEDTSRHRQQQSEDEHRVQLAVSTLHFIRYTFESFPHSSSNHHSDSVTSASFV
jgi:hypothetical protein